MISKYLSDKLKAVSFVSILLVVFLHAYNLKINMLSESLIIKKGFNSFIQYFLSYGVTRIAVPLFFMISGYLFFLKMVNYSIYSFLDKYKKRVKTLAIPYLAWSILGLMLYYVLQYVPISKPFFTNLLIKNYDLKDFFNSIFFNPIPYQFWFIRDLIVLVLISPLIAFIIRLNWVLVFLFFIVWFFDVNFIAFTSESLLFFSIGGVFSIKKIDIQNPINFPNAYVLFLVLWMLLLITKTLFYFYNFEGEILINGIHKLSLITGIIAIWKLYDAIYYNKDISKTKIYKLFKYTFFIFACHEPLLTIFKKGYYYFLGRSELSSFIIYFLAAISVIFICIILASLLKLWIPKIYMILTGNR